MFQGPFVSLFTNLFTFTCFQNWQTWGNVKVTRGLPFIGCSCKCSPSIHSRRILVPIGIFFLSCRICVTPWKNFFFTFKILYFNSIFNDFYFSIIVGFLCCQFLPYSKVTHSHIYIYILFLTLSSIMFHHKWYSSLCCSAGSHCLSVPNAIVCVY